MIMKFIAIGDRAILFQEYFAPMVIDTIYLPNQSKSLGMKTKASIIDRIPKLNYDFADYCTNNTNITDIAMQKVGLDYIPIILLTQRLRGDFQSHFRAEIYYNRMRLTLDNHEYLRVERLVAIAASPFCFNISKVKKNIFLLALYTNTSESSLWCYQFRIAGQRAERVGMKVLNNKNIFSNCLTSIYHREIFFACGNDLYYSSFEGPHNKLSQTLIYSMKYKIHTLHFADKKENILMVSTEKMIYLFAVTNNNTKIKLLWAKGQHELNIANVHLTNACGITPEIRTSLSKSKFYVKDIPAENLASYKPYQSSLFKTGKQTEAIDPKNSRITLCHPRNIFRRSYENKPTQLLLEFHDQGRFYMMRFSYDKSKGEIMFDDITTNLVIQGQIIETYKFFVLDKLTTEKAVDLCCFIHGTLDCMPEPNELAEKWIDHALEHIGFKYVNNGFVTLDPMGAGFVNIN